MFKIALNAGHGIKTSGKRCLKSIDPNETREWVLNSRICNKIEEKLKSYSGYELIRLDDTTGNTDVPLKQRTDKANRFGADFYLSIHHNAGINGGSGGGVIAIAYKTVTAGSETFIWQYALYSAVIKKTGLKGNRSQQLQYQNLHEVRESNMPAVILECGFMDSTTDTPIILTEAFADKVATACVEVIVRKGNLKLKEQPKPVKAEVEVVRINTKSTYDIAQEVIAGKWGNGEDRKNRLSAAGYNPSEVQACVNTLCGKEAKKDTKKSTGEIAKEVIQGKWGKGAERKQRLTAAGYNYSDIQKIVNKLMK